MAKDIQPVSLSDSLVAKEPFDETDLESDDYTFASTMRGFVISNDHASDALTFTIGADIYTVEAGEVFSEEFADFTVVTVTSAGTLDFRAYGLGVR